MKKKSVLLWGLQIMRIAATVLTFTGASAMSALSMYSIPFLLALAFDAPHISAWILVGYLVVFFLSLIFLFIRRTKILSIISLIVIIIADLCAIALSAFWGSNHYYLVGLPVCAVELVLLTMNLRSAVGQQKINAATNGNEE